MSTLERKYTIQHVMAETTEDGALIEIADVLSQANELMQVLPWHPTNRALDNLTGRDTSFPTPAAITSNEGALQQVSETEQVIDVPIHYSSIIAPHKLTLRGVNDVEEWYARKIKKEGIAYSEAIASQIIAGDSLVTPGKSIDGLQKRLGSLPTSATDVTDRYYTVVGGGGTGSDNTSIYLLGLGLEGVHGIYLKNGQAGFTVMRMPNTPITAANGGIFFSNAIDMSWDIGITATNTRAMGRICNIDHSALTHDASAGVNLTNVMYELAQKVRHSDMGLTPVWCANNEIITYFKTQRANKANNAVGLDKDYGKAMTTFDGIPMLRMDTIGIAEATVT